MNDRFARLRTIPAVLFILICFSAAFAQKPIRDLKPTVILISIDGFRYDYFEKFQPPEINRLAREGVRARWMTPAFPTKTFPNHYTVATGLYPAHHGIVENNVFDFGVLFSMSKREEVQNPRWWLGEPIWVTAVKQGQRSAAMFFPGSEAPIGGYYATFWKPYEHTLPHEKRVEAILGWLDLPREQRPTFYTLYFSDVDSAGHDAGPDSAETRDAVLKVDAAIKMLMDGLKQRKVDKKVNVILFSDHGMSAVDQRNATLIDDYISLNDTERIIWTNEFLQIFPRAGKTDAIIDKLRSIKGAQCWKKDEIPARFHYNDSPRIAPVICLADDGRILSSRERYATLKKRKDFGTPKGGHGYDNELESMRAMFVGHGRAFKKGKVVEPFENVDAYELMCKILGLRPAKNDGRFERVKGMLR
jgi:predicted AlkP superfamily pyrophosphatase or phosphodiesterase